jgi:hypothetical protein
VLVQAFLVCVAAAAGFASDLQNAKSRYFAAVDGDEKALSEARQIFEQLRSTHPKDAVILAYAGSVQLLQASHTLAPWRKGKLAKEGLGQLDEAVRAAPDNLEVRFVRAASTYHLPGFFKREKQSEDDFAWLSSRVAAAVASRSLDARIGAAALYHHGLFKEKAGDQAAARSAWQEAVRTGPETRAGGDARKRLQQN